MNRLEQRRRNQARIAQQRREATHCKRGHEMTPENTILRQDGRRMCRTCQYDRDWYSTRGLPWVR